MTIRIFQRLVRGYPAGLVAGGIGTSSAEPDPDMTVCSPGGTRSRIRLPANAGPPHAVLGGRFRSTPGWRCSANDLGSAARPPPDAAAQQKHHGLAGATRTAAPAGIGEHRPPPKPTAQPCLSPSA
jgi:hypothetical protein